MRISSTHGKIRVLFTFDEVLDWDQGALRQGLVDAALEVFRRKCDDPEVLAQMFERGVGVVTPAPEEEGFLVSLDLLDDKPSNVVVVVEGGAVQEVLADPGVNVFVLDGDLQPPDVSLWGRDWKLLVGGDYDPVILTEALETINRVVSQRE